MLLNSSTAFTRASNRAVCLSFMIVSHFLYRHEKLVNGLSFAIMTDQLGSGYYEEPEFGDKVLGRNVFHPIRLTKPFFDHFLSDFDIIFNNCDGEHTIRGWQRRKCGERGYYAIARKKLQPAESEKSWFSLAA